MKKAWIAAAAVAAAAAGLVPAPAYASDWFEIDRAPDASNILFVDKESILISDIGRSQASVYSVMARDDEYGAAAHYFTVEFDCAEPRSRPLSMRAFNAAGREILHEDAGGEWTPVEPDTQGESMRNFACSNGRSHPDAISRGSQIPLALGRRLLGGDVGGK